MASKAPLRIAVLCVFTCYAQYALSAATRIIPAGTLLRCTLSEPNFSSKTAALGDPVLCDLGATSSFGHVLFPRGAALSGRLEGYKNPGHFTGKGWLEFTFDRIILPDGTMMPLSAKVVSAPHRKVDSDGKIDGTGHPKRDVVEWMIPPLWPIKVVTLPARGPYPTLKGETKLSLRLMEDIEFEPPVANARIPAPPWASVR